jgi:tetratricopeptide (TPR) repeat protein
MAYVRQRGNQLAIVRGVRDAATGKVEQQILMTLYSQDEAREAVGPGARRLQSLLRQKFRGVRLDWEAITKGIEEKLEVLPAAYDRRSRARGPGAFRESLSEFVRQLGFADPQRLTSAAEVIRENADALAFLRDLIDWRLRCGDAKPSEFTDDPFDWRLSLERQGIPLDLEEFVDGLLERGEEEKAQAALRLLLDAFGEDADAHNSLGGIALEKGKLEEACAEFEEAARIGRRAFPRKIAKNRYWSELETRPYIRALRSLAVAQNQIGRYDGALATCERLDKECGDDLSANWTRAAVGLNTGRFDLAFKAATYCRGIYGDEDLVAAFAAHELGRSEDAVVAFLHGALSNRRAARMILGERTTRPQSSDEVRDHNDGVALKLAIKGYLESRRGKAAVLVFRALKARPEVAELLSEMEAVVRRWKGDNKTAGWRDASDRMNRMRTVEFATERARRVMGDAKDQD